MSNQIAVSEDELIKLGGLQALQAFSAYLFEQKEKRVHLMSSTRHITVRSGGMNIVTNASGDLYPDGIEKFIEAESQDPDCFGLVPLTEEADRVLQAKGLRVLTWDSDNIPTNKYRLYRT